MSTENQYAQLTDVSTGETTDVTVPTERTVSEALTMVLGEDEDVMFGRMPSGLDESEFDYLPPFETEIDVNDKNMFLGEGEESPEMFESPPDEQFPMFKNALRKFKSVEPKSRVVRVDTDDTHDIFMGEKAAKEIRRRVSQVRGALSDGSPRWNNVVLGAAQAISNLSAAKSADDAAEAMPKVPLDLPSYAVGKVKCWRDGDSVVLSMRFAAADGTPRVATMAARPNVDADEVEAWAMRSGVDPVTLLGAVPDVADAVCGKRLLRDVAGAALMVRELPDVQVMGDEPMLLAAAPTASSAPLAALMHVEQLAGAGHPQARAEMRKLRAVARTSAGQKVIAPLMSKSSARLSGRAPRSLAAKPTFAQKYALMAMGL